MSDTKWVACWGNATSIKDQTEAMYAKNITLRYPIRMCFSGSAIRLHFSNLTGTEPVEFKATIGKGNASDNSGKTVCLDTLKNVTFSGNAICHINPGAECISDEIAFDVSAGETLQVSMYLPDVTQLNAATLVTGPLSKGFYAYGDYMASEELPIDLTRNTNWFYFLNTIDIYTEEKNFALVCYGDSITAQSWPDYLSLRAWEEGYRDVAIIRRAVCGTRILRQYDCITYAAYGLKGATRFPMEMNVAGARSVLIQHGINDIIHPVGKEINVFRPMSDLPTCEELVHGIEELYISHAKALGLQVWGGTLLPIYGWRTYADFREVLKNELNAWIRQTNQFDGCVDFDLAVRDEADSRRFKDGYDSGDHLHPSEEAYKAMAYAIPEELLR